MSVATGRGWIKWTYGEGVATHVVRAHGKVGDLQVLDTVDIQSLVQNTMLDNAVAFTRSDTASTKRMPGGFNMALDPLLDVRN